jgi:hypothetical protein
MELIYLSIGLYKDMSVGMSEVTKIRKIAILTAHDSHVTTDNNIIYVLPCSCLPEDGTDNCSWVGEWSYLRHVCNRATSTLVGERPILSHSVYNRHSIVLRPSSRLTSQKG